MNTMDTGTSEKMPRRFRKRWISRALVALCVVVAVWNTTKPMQAGTNLRSEPIVSNAADVQFLSDLSFTDIQGSDVREQQIFDAIFRIVDESQTFVIADMFLFNEFMGTQTTPAYRALSGQLVDRLITRKQAQPNIEILFVTDPINEIYGGMHSAQLDRLRKAGVQVVTTDLEKLRDSNPVYSSFWRIFLQWAGNSTEGGWMPNPFQSSSGELTLRSWLQLLNFKANHRKLIVADRSDGALAGLVASANPHDASSGHSNVALRFTGPLALELAQSEMSVARFSGWTGSIYTSTGEVTQATDDEAVKLQFLTEGSIRDHLLESIDATRNGDAVDIATFYLADRGVVESLLSAADRDVKVRLILDPNKDAFGRQKDGVPNRPVANELVTVSGGKIDVRWYRTHGEQFHTKLALIRRGERFIASLGSANLTRRNLGNYNLEANVVIESSATSPLAIQMLGYFDRLWTNNGTEVIEFTAPFGAYQDTDRTRYWRYRFMEATGLSTF